ncbi:hypothetical protein H310_02077 [Aphanomyces invadans]|uniref:Spondin-like TSP1 domain-containing protein n=1 Tax=Aphanomyces invadans TaxID=157072 RepID=A0A024UMB3_9STRA|nr:hypothetical protein H310_02077 [Aphanomyces invadans]ETW07601.1 hypothetical protein H310_02077 [Aphanomyces invadans]|eukprot:XP_008863694.1 hypothetical protein H310_02077 [Aphanomyces invadans]
MLHTRASKVRLWILATATSGLALAAYRPIDVVGVTDPVLLARIEGYMPPICSSLYGDSEHWTDWSICSAKCGAGQQVRYLTNAGIENLQSNGCEISIDKRNCTGTMCPRDCQYSDWLENNGTNGGWGVCDKATGSQARKRVEIMSAANGGKSCPELWGAPTQTKNCPIDCEGNYGPWETKCNGKNGTVTRPFIVTVAPLNGGADCPALFDTMDCNPACTEIPWGQYSECSPITGNRTRTRDVPVDANWLKITTILKENKCPTIDVQPCNVHCQLGKWTDEKVATCNSSTGLKTLTRRIVQPARFCGTPCNSTEHDTLLTKTVPCNVPCILDSWGPWTCDKSTGLATRIRAVLQAPLNNGTTCGITSQTQDCRSVTCPNCAKTCEPTDWVSDNVCNVTTCMSKKTRTRKYPVRDADKPCSLEAFEPCTADAIMGPWSAWSECDEHARRTRSRGIVSPACNWGGVASHTTETQSCQSICLPRHNPWPVDKDGQEVWGPCNQATGMQTRRRVIVKPPTADQEPCRTSESRTCAVNCVLDAWSPWSKCEANSGLRNRTRRILQPMLNGGSQCGPTQETEKCPMACLTGEWSPWSPPDDKCVCHSTRDQLTPAINGGPCILKQFDPSCVQNCEVGSWNATGKCHVAGPRAGYRRLTRSVLARPCNGGASCGATESWEPCDVHCAMGNWSSFGQCDLETQTQTAERTILHTNFGNGKSCGATVKTRPCGACADLLTPYQYGVCNPAVGTRTGIASWKYPPKQGQQCALRVKQRCAVDCKLSAWKAGPCNVRGPLAGKKSFTRNVLVQPLNGGKQCEALEKVEKCRVDCKPTNKWGPWGQCLPNGLMNRTLLIDYPAQHGGSNDACTVMESKACAVDCIIDTSTGEVTRGSLNGGLTCQEVAAAAGLDGDYSDVSGSSHFSVLASQHKEVVMSMVAAGGVGLMFMVGALQRRYQAHRQSYSSMAQA